jgi:hypothetical protein
MLAAGSRSLRPLYPERLPIHADRDILLALIPAHPKLVALVRRGKTSCRDEQHTTPTADDVQL